MRSRIKSFLADIGKKHRGEKILIVTHKGVIAAAGTVLNGQSLAKVNDYPIGNCEWIKFVS